MSASRTRAPASPTRRPAWRWTRTRTPATLDCAWTAPVTVTVGVCFSCTNGVKDGDESGVDCGGASGCAPCGGGAACLVASDCASNMCVDGLCVSFTNDVEDGHETCVDGGGPAPDVCGEGEGCEMASDCDDLLKTCRRLTVAERCGDGVLSAEEASMETCVDGGGLCTTLEPPLKCADGGRLQGRRRLQLRALPDLGDGRQLRHLRLLRRHRADGHRD